MGVDQVKAKVQRLLTNRFGSVKIDKDGDFVITFESAVTFIAVDDWEGIGSLIVVRCPLVTDVKVTNELCRWVAVEGQQFRIGSCMLRPKDDGTGWVWFRSSLMGDDLDEDELMTTLDAVVLTSNRLDNELQTRFGGNLFGSE